MQAKPDQFVNQIDFVALRLVALTILQFAVLADVITLRIKMASKCTGYVSSADPRIFVSMT